MNRHFAFSAVILYDPEVPNHPWHVVFRGLSQDNKRVEVRHFLSSKREAFIKLAEFADGLEPGSTKLNLGLPDGWNRGTPDRGPHS